MLQHSIDSTVSIGAAVPVDLLYTLLLLAAGAYVMRRRAPTPVARGLAAVDRERAIIPM